VKEHQTAVQTPSDDNCLSGGENRKQYVAETGKVREGKKGRKKVGLLNWNDLQKEGRFPRGDPLREKGQNQQGNCGGKYERPEPFFLS